MVTYKYNKIVNTSDGILRLKSWHELQGGCDYNELELKENGTYKVVDKGFLTRQELKILKEV